MIPAENRMGLEPVFWLAIALGGVAAAAAIFTARDLAYDGSYYLLGVATHGAFQLFEHGRIASQILQQGFALVGARLGIHDLWTLGVLFSLGASGWPVILTALCWFVLPRGEKSWIAGPLLNLIFAIPATNFIGIGEGIIASCLLWTAFLLVEFRSRNLPGAVVCVVATAVCAFSHEAAILCLLVIAFAAVVQSSDAKGFRRVALFLAAAIALAGAGNMAHLILVPRSPVERSDFLVSTLGGFFGTPAAPNIPVLASLVAATGCLVALRFREKRAWVTAIAAITIIVILFVLFVANPERMIAPSRYFAARGLPVALTTLLTALFLFLRRRGVTPRQFATPPVIAILASLAIGQTVGQLTITAQWASYVRDLRNVVSTGRGVVTDATAMELLDPNGARFRRELLENWSVEPLSLLLAPKGHVHVLVEASPKARWVPYDLANPATLPHVPGLDYSGFVSRPSR